MNGYGDPKDDQAGTDTQAGEKGTKPGDEDIIKEAKSRFKIAVEAENENHREGLNDLEFLKGNQWPAAQRQQREAEGRPVLTINKLPTFLQQITNDQRQNRASIKVSPVSEEATTDVADIIQGAIRHIEYDSAADVAYDTAVNSSASNGFGFWRLVTEYEAGATFDQKLMVKRIRNAFTVHMDPASQEADGSDMQWCFISTKMSKAEFKAKYPEANCAHTSGFGTATGDKDANWEWSDQVRVAEYYRIKFQKTTIYLLSNGQIVEKLPQPMPEGITEVNRRSYLKRTVEWFLLSPYEVLERTEIKCQWIPVFPVWGTEIDADGKVYRAGLIRNAKDPAMMYNFWMTCATEEVSMRPKTPYIGAAGQFEGFEKQWRQANNRTYAYLEYNPVEVNGNLAPPPQRQGMVDVPSGLLAMAQHASDNIKQTTGLFDSSLGAQGNATSGKQELAQQKQGSVTNWHYMDNFFRSLRHCGRCMIDMMPHYYDTERLVQCRGEDGSIKGVTINKWDEAAQKFVNDIRIGRYSVAVTPGPSYATMRAEAADAMIQFGQSWPKLMDIAGDKVVKAMNWPGAEEIAERIAKTIPANLKGGEDGQEESPIPPEAQQQIDQLKQQLQEAQQDADKNRADIRKAEIAAEAQKEAARIAAESRKDVAELAGMVKLLIENMRPSPALSQEVAQDFTKDDQQGAEQVPQVAEQRSDMNGASVMPTE
jgi:hypothetical protein